MARKAGERWPGCWAPGLEAAAGNAAHCKDNLENKTRLPRTRLIVYLGPCKCPTTTTAGTNPIVVRHPSDLHVQLEKQRLEFHHEVASGHGQRSFRGAATWKSSRRGSYETQHACLPVKFHRTSDIRRRPRPAAHARGGHPAVVHREPQEKQNGTRSKVPETVLRTRASRTSLCKGELGEPAAGSGEDAYGGEKLITNFRAGDRTV